MHGSMNIKFLIQLLYFPGRTKKEYINCTTNDSTVIWRRPDYTFVLKVATHAPSRLVSV